MVPHGWLVQEISAGALHAASAAGITQICPRANILTPAAVQAAVDAGMSVRAWGVKDMQVRCMGRSPCVSDRPCHAWAVTGAWPHVPDQIRSGGAW